MTTSGFAYVNGQYCSVEEARLSVLDPGFTHSDAAYDVVSTAHGYFFRLDDHLRRFRASCAGFRIPLRYSDEALREILATCVERGGVSSRAYCALVLTRGPYSAAGIASRDIFTTSPVLIAYAVPYVSIATPAKAETGMSAIIAETPRIPSACIDARYKNYQWGDLTKGKFEARDAGADVAFHLSTDGYLTEGAGFNLFFFARGRLGTPAHNIFLGLTRQSVLDLAADFGVPADCGDFGADVLVDAEEIFLTSTAGGIVPVVRVGERAVGDGRPGALTRRLRDAYWQRRAAGWLGTPVAGLAAATRPAAAAGGAND